MKIWDGAILNFVFLILPSYHFRGHVSATVSSFAMASMSAVIDFLHTHGCDLEYSLKVLYCVLVSNFHPFWDLETRDMPCYISFLFKSLCRKVKNSHECLLERPFLRLLKENENGLTKGVQKSSTWRWWCMENVYHRILLMVLPCIMLKIPDLLLKTIWCTVGVWLSLYYCVNQ